METAEPAAANDILMLRLQDVFYEIRHTLLVKLRKYLPLKQHGTRWYILPFLSAEDPEADNKEYVCS